MLYFRESYCIPLFNPVRLFYRYFTFQLYRDVKQHLCVKYLGLVTNGTEASSGIVAPCCLLPCRFFFKQLSCYHHRFIKSCIFCCNKTYLSWNPVKCSTS